MRIWTLPLAVSMASLLSLQAHADVEHRVVRGDTLWELSRTYRTSVGAIQRANGISGSLIRVGQVLTIPTGDARPADPAPTAPPTSEVVYVVKRGDTLSRIAQRYDGVSHMDIARANRLANPDLIRVGQRLRIPGGGETGLPLPSQPPISPPASQPPSSVSASDLEVLARIVKGEAGGTPFEGKVAVAAVVLNRVRSSRFPNSIPGVVHQPWQFSAYNPSHRDRLYWGPIPQSAWEAARAALSGQDPSRGATYFFNPYVVSPTWAKSMHFLVRIGTSARDTHDFYSPHAPTSSTPPAASGATHVVVRGDTLGALARRYNTTVAALRALNGIPPTSSLIRVGQRLRLPEPRLAGGLSGGLTK